MHTQFNFTIALAVLAAALSASGSAEAKTKQHHPAGRGAGSATAAELKTAQAEISALQTRLTDLEARLDQQNGAQTAAATQAASATQLATTAAAKADQAVATANAAQTTANTTAAHPAVPDALKWASDTQINGRMFIDESTISQHTNGGPNAATGTGFNIKRMYLGVDHQFNQVFSGSLLMDISNVIGETANTNFVTPTANTSTGAISSQAVVGKGFYLKNAFLQAKLNPALVIRAGSAPLPWIPYIESQYGYRQIENTTVDRLSYGYTADWGIHALGDLAGGLISYQVSAIDGGGYRNVKVTKHVDVEGRVSAQYKGLWAAVGGYTGKRADDTEALTNTATTFRTAKRADVGAGYKNSLFNVGGEYYYAKNWNNVTVNPTTYVYSQDAAQGYSLFSNLNFAPRWSLFGRYDWNEPNKFTDPSLRDHYYNVGVQWEPVRIVDIALVFKHETARGGAISTSDGVIGCSTTATADAFTTDASRLAGICTGDGTYSELGIFGQLKFEL